MKACELVKKYYDIGGPKRYNDGGPVTSLSHMSDWINNDTINGDRFPKRVKAGMTLVRLENHQGWYKVYHVSACRKMVHVLGEMGSFTRNSVTDFLYK